MLDLAGNDVGYRQRKELGLTDTDSDIRKCVKYSTLPDKLCEAGFFGQKTKRGWYEYSPNNPRKPIESKATTEFIEHHCVKEGIVRKNIFGDEIIARCMYPLINEGFKILDEGIASKPEDIDLVYTFGYGFPSYRGGPM